MAEDSAEEQGLAILGSRSPSPMADQAHAASPSGDGVLLRGDPKPARLTSDEAERGAAAERYNSVYILYSVRCGDCGNASAYSSRDPRFDPRPFRSVI